MVDDSTLRQTGVGVILGERGRHELVDHCDAGRLVLVGAVVGEDDCSPVEWMGMGSYYFF